MSPFHGIDLPSETIRAAAAGDRDAHEAIYRQYQRPVYTLIRRLINRPAVADDLFQEVFVEILRSVGGYHGRGLVQWLGPHDHVNKCLMYLRSPWHRSLSGSMPKSPSRRARSRSSIAGPRADTRSRHRPTSSAPCASVTPHTHCRLAA